MQTLTLYPTTKNTRLGLYLGGGAFVFGGYLATLGGNAEFAFFAYFAMGSGVWTTVRSAFQMYHKRPVFEADENGFSVKGKAKRPWSEFRGVSIYNASTSLFSIVKMLRVKVGTSILGGYVQINPLQLSDSAKVMAMQIEDFARTVKSGSVLAAVDKYPVPSLDVPPLHAQPAMHTMRPPTPAAPVNDFATPIPQPAFTQRARPTDGGPVRSTPRLSERIFGRSKVL